MKFREYGNVFPKTISASNEEELDKKIEELGAMYNIIDLQFSTSQDLGFSALLLIKEK